MRTVTAPTPEAYVARLDLHIWNGCDCGHISFAPLCMELCKRLVCKFVSLRTLLALGVLLSNRYLSISFCRSQRQIPTQTQKENSNAKRAGDVPCRYRSCRPRTARGDFSPSAYGDLAANTTYRACRNAGPGAQSESNRDTRAALSLRRDGSTLFGCPPVRV